MVEFQKIRDNPPLSVYVKKPDGQGPFPCVLVFMHRPGPDNAMQKVVDDLAVAGYVGVLQDAYRNETIRSSYSDQTIFEDFEATLAHVKSLNFVNKEKIGVMGFCMGGRHAYLASSRYPDVKATVSYYGFPGQGKETRDTPVKVVDQMHHPVLGIFGGIDILFPFTDVEEFRDHLLKQSNKNKVVVYPDVGHGFLNPFAPERYKDGVSAKKAWQETVDFYNKNIK